MRLSQVMKPCDNTERPAGTRRELLKSVGAGAIGLVISPAAFAGVASPAAMSPNEDLMQEHALLNRVQLIYDEALRRLESGISLDPALVKRSAEIIRRFVEDYHEKNEEEYVFPEFEKRGKLVSLVKLLRIQHIAGRKVTQEILTISSLPRFGSTTDQAKLIAALKAFNRMYHPHAAREGSVLFPAFRDLLPPQQFYELGDRFERIEHEVLGREGFEGQVEQVAEIEKALGIHDLAQFTPAV